MVYRHANIDNPCAVCGGPATTACPLCGRPCCDAELPCESDQCPLCEQDLKRHERRWNDNRLILAMILPLAALVVGLWVLLGEWTELLMWPLYLASLGLATALSTALWRRRRRRGRPR